jgi:flavin reductase (DIM6/NTAB) family NADH-FMN oxidoreductase RutF
MKKSIGPKTVGYPTPVVVVGTYDKQGKPNAMTAAWSGICCSTPPCIAVSLRKATYSYGAIVERKAFTISVPSEHFVRETDYLGLASGANEDKFAAAGLTPVRSTLVDAPYVEQFPVVLECKLLHALEIGLHTLFVGEIVDIKVDEAFVGPEGFADIAATRPILFAPGVRSYFGVGEPLGKAFSIGKNRPERKYW